MGKIRVAALGDESEKEQKRRADARRQTKKSKKEKVEGVGLHGGERVAVVEGTEIKSEYKKLVEEVEGDKTTEKKIKEKGKNLPAGKAGKKEKTRSQRFQTAAKLVDKNKSYTLDEAVKLVKLTSLTRFDGTVELHLNLSSESLGDKKEFRASVTLPHSTGKTIRVVIADESVLANLEKGIINFDVLVSPPAMMAKLAKFAKVLGPRGLMPNPKNGTVSDNPEKRAKELSGGQIQIKTEPDHPILHLTVGKVSYPEKNLAENIAAYLTAIGRRKIAKATLASTMGPGIKLVFA